MTLPNIHSENFKPSEYKICKEFGSYMKPGKNSFDFENTINHNGVVYKARSCYKSYNLIATKSDFGAVNIFDYTKHGIKEDNEEARPEMILYGHNTEGWGLDWSVSEHRLISSDDQGFICYWDINKPITR